MLIFMTNQTAIHSNNLYPCQPSDNDSVETRSLVV